MAYTTFQTLQKLLGFTSLLVLGISNVISNIIYSYSTPFNSPALQETFITFLFLSAVIQLISWSSILVKVRYKNDSVIYQNALLNANSNFQALYIISKREIVKAFKLAQCLFANLPLIFVITFFQKLKVFPIVLFGYTYYKYKAVLTTDLITSLEPIMNSYYKKKSQMLQVQKQNENTDRRRNAIDQEKSVMQNLAFQTQLVNDIEQFNQKMNSINKPQIAFAQDFRLQKPNLQELHQQSHIQNVQNPISTQNQTDLENQIKIAQKQPSKKVQNLNNTNNYPQNQNDYCPNSNTNLSNLQDNLRKSLIQHDQEQSYDKNMIQIELPNHNNILNKQTINLQIQQTVQDQINQSLDVKQIFGKRVTTIIESEQNTENSSYFGINLLIDSNIIPNIQALLFDKNLEKFQTISDVLEAVFESLPMAVIQYINNTQNKSWFNQDGSLNIFLVAVFVSSCVSLFLHFISLIKLLYNKDISIFTQVLEYLDESTNERNSLQTQLTNQIQQGQSNNDKSIAYKQAAVASKKMETNFGQIFPMRAKVEIDCVEQLYKLVRLTDKAAQRIKQLIVHLPSNSFSKAEISTNLIQVFSKLQYLNSLSLNLEGNQMEDVLCRPMFISIFSKFSHLNDLNLYLEKQLLLHQKELHITIELNLRLQISLSQSRDEKGTKKYKLKH